MKSDQTFEIEPARKGESVTVFARRQEAPGVEPFAVLPDGGWIGAKIARTDPGSGKSYRAVLLGFFLADVKGDDDRRAVLKEALAFLDVPEAATPVGAAGTGASAGNGEKPAASGARD